MNKELKELLGDKMIAVMESEAVREPKEQRKAVSALYGRLTKALKK